jgi:hypothetical protein
VLSDVVLQLDIELDETVHSNADGACLNEHYPDVSECRVQRLLTVPAKCLGCNGHARHEDADETVLEDPRPDDLFQSAELGARW